MRNVGWRTVALLAALLAMATLGSAQSQSPVGKTIEPGATGWAVKRPVIAAACPQACPWGELGEFVRDAMKPLGYEVILCRNCNRAEGPRIVGKASHPPPLTPDDVRIGTTERVEAPVDFGITESTILTGAYEGEGAYARDGPYKNLRLIAKIEDPTYLLVAVRADSGITDLSQVLERKKPVRILSSGAAAQAVLDYYGLTRQALSAIGGSIGPAMGSNRETNFDVIVSDLGSPANNPEGSFFPTMAYRYDLKFLDLPEPLLAKLARENGLIRVTAKWGLLRGIDHPIATVARSGEAVFARADTPEKAAYDVAKAIDQHRGDLRWYVRPYSYDPLTASQNGSVPLHPGAARYYREKGYLRR